MFLHEHRLGYKLRYCILMVGSIQNINTHYSVNPAIKPAQAGYIKHIMPQDLYVKDGNKSISRNMNRSVDNYRVPAALQYQPKQVLRSFTNKQYVESLMEKNPRIGEILDSVGVENPEIYPENILNMMNGHITTTTAYALQIANAMNLSPIDKKVLEQAAVFHDFGKILMPKEIIEKPGALTPEERKIMDTHAEVGEELLKGTGLNRRVINLIGNHHNPGTDDILCQILSVADIYSALREPRSYKAAMPVGEALSILDQKAEKGEVSTEVVSALKDSLMAACA